MSEMQIIRDKILSGDGRDVDRILQAALIKSDEAVRNQILTELTPDYLAGCGWLFGFIIKSIRTKGYVDVAEVYREIEDWARSNLPAHMAAIDEMFTLETPDAATLDKAIGLLLSDKPQITDEHDAAVKTVIVALLKGSDEIRNLVLAENYADYFYHGDREIIYELAAELYNSKGEIREEDLRYKMEEYVGVDMLKTFTGRIDAVLATATPDAQTVELAIAWFIKHGLRIKDI